MIHAQIVCPDPQDHEFYGHYEFVHLPAHDDKIVVMTANQQVRHVRVLYIEHYPAPIPAQSEIEVGMRHHVTIFVARIIE